MLNIFKPHTFVRFSADVFQCQQCFTGNGLSYWNLRLLTQGKLIDAFHWDDAEYPMLHYKERDGIMVLGRWNNKRKERLQVLQSRIITSFAANDDIYDPNAPQQLELDFGDDHKLIKGVRNAG